MLTPTKGPLGTQWTAPHSLLLNSLIHSRTNMRSQQACKRLRSYRGEFAARDLRTHDRRARSQPAAHQTRLAESFQRICGSSRASHESKRHEDIAAAACVSSTSRGGAGNQLGSPGISAAREPQEPLSARTRDEVFSAGHYLVVSSSPPTASPEAARRPLTRQHSLDQAQRRSEQRVLQKTALWRRLLHSGSGSDCGGKIPDAHSPALPHGQRQPASRMALFLF